MSSLPLCTPHLAYPKLSYLTRSRTRTDPRVKTETRTPSCPLRPRSHFDRTLRRRGKAYPSLPSASQRRTGRSVGGGVSATIGGVPVGTRVSPSSAAGDKAIGSSLNPDTDEVVVTGGRRVNLWAASGHSAAPGAGAPGRSASISHGHGHGGYSTRPSPCRARLLPEVRPAPAPPRVPCRVPSEEVAGFRPWSPREDSGEVDRLRRGTGETPVPVGVRRDCRVPVGSLGVWAAAMIRAGDRAREGMSEIS
jgi:hypothetical protein